MPSFDIVSRVNFAEIDNAINNTKKAVAQRFDFRGAKVEITVDQKEKKINLLTEDGSKMEALREMFLSAAMRRGLSDKAFDFGETLPSLGGLVKREVKIANGLEQDVAKDIVKRIKEAKLKVTASIQGEEVRLTGKQIDDMQTVMKLLDGAELAVPLQYVNLKRD